MSVSCIGEVPSGHSRPHSRAALVSVVVCPWVTIGLVQELHRCLLLSALGSQPASFKSCIGVCCCLPSGHSRPCSIAASVSAVCCALCRGPERLHGRSLANVVWACARLKHQ